MLFLLSIVGFSVCQVSYLCVVQLDVLVQNTSLQI